MFFESQAKCGKQCKERLQRIHLSTLRQHCMAVTEAPVASLPGRARERMHLLLEMCQMCHGHVHLDCMQEPNPVQQRMYDEVELELIGALPLAPLNNVFEEISEGWNYTV